MSLKIIIVCFVLGNVIGNTQITVRQHDILNLTCYVNPDYGTTEVCGFVKNSTNLTMFNGLVTLRIPVASLSGLVDISFKPPRSLGRKYLHFFVTTFDVCSILNGKRDFLIEFVMKTLKNYTNVLEGCPFQPNQYYINYPYTGALFPFDIPRGIYRVEDTFSTGNVTVLSIKFFAKYF